MPSRTKPVASKVGAQPALPPILTDAVDEQLRQLDASIRKNHRRDSIRSELAGLVSRHIGQPLRDRILLYGDVIRRHRGLPQYERIAGSYVDMVDKAFAEPDRDNVLALMQDRPALVRTRDYLEFKYGYIAKLLADLGPMESVLEAGAGELTTLTNVVTRLERAPADVFALELYWSRLFVGRQYASKRGVRIRELVVGSVAMMPFADGAVDVVFTHHCLEGCRNQLREALRELCRVARRYVVLIEPSYELAHPLQQKRMEKLGYVRGIPSTARKLGLNVIEHHRTPVSEYENASAVTILQGTGGASSGTLACPRSKDPLVDADGWLYSRASHLAYPRLQGIACLLPQHGVMAFKLAETLASGAPNGSKL